MEKQREIVLYYFSGTFSRFLEPQFVDISVKIDGRKRVSFLYPYNGRWYIFKYLRLIYSSSFEILLLLLDLAA